jgi:hypothetical protein
LSGCKGYNLEFRIIPVKDVKVMKVSTSGAHYNYISFIHIITFWFQNRRVIYFLENWASIQKLMKNNNIVYRMRNNIYYVKLSVINNVNIFAVCCSKVFVPPLLSAYEINYINQNEIN